MSTQISVPACLLGVPEATLKITLKFPVNKKTPPQKHILRKCLESSKQRISTVVLSKMNPRQSIVKIQYLPTTEKLEP